MDFPKEYGTWVPVKRPAVASGSGVRVSGGIPWTVPNPGEAPALGPSSALRHGQFVFTSERVPAQVPSYSRLLAINDPAIASRMNLAGGGGGGGVDRSQFSFGKAFPASRESSNAELLQLFAPKPQYTVRFPLLPNLNSLPAESNSVVPPPAMNQRERTGGRPPPPEIINLDDDDEPTSYLDLLGTLNNQKEERIQLDLLGTVNNQKEERIQQDHPPPSEVIDLDEEVTSYQDLLRMELGRLPQLQPRGADNPSEQCVSNQVQSSQIVDNQCHEAEGNVVSAVVDSVQVHIPQQVEGEMEGIDLNKTPATKPKRKKHRPKVIREGKPSRAPKAANPKPATPTPATTAETPTAKRKYVRRKKDINSQETPSKPQENPLGAADGERTDKESQTRTKTARRSLNFTAEDSQTADRLSGSGTAANSRTESPVQCSQAQGPVVLESSTRCGIGFDLNSSNQCQNESVRIKQAPCHPQQPRQETARTKWQQDFERMVNNMHRSQQHAIREGGNLKKLARMMSCREVPDNSSQNLAAGHGPVASSRSSDLQQQAAKRHYIVVGNAQVPEKMRASNPGSNEATISNLCPPDIHKRRRTETGQNELAAAVSSLLGSTPGDRRHDSAMKTTCEVLTFAAAQRLAALEKTQPFKRMPVINQIQGETNRIRHEPELYGPKAQVQALLDKKERSKARTRGRKMQESVVNYVPIYTNHMEHAVTGSIHQRFNNENAHLGVHPAEDCHASSSYKVSGYHGFQPEPYRVKIDEITAKLCLLNINVHNERAVPQPHNALVPYVGGNGVMVPYEGLFEPVKRRKPRPKVDLDPESHRVWRLLMGLEQGEEGTDLDKEKWWENERRVFRGRVDSFVARMRLIQGDRRFSPWKGSVVDSVIGVYLTQNVSDHLSSSAFMCLAARFPAQLKESTKSTDGQTINRSIVISDINKWNREILQPELCSRSSLGTYGSEKKDDRGRTNSCDSLESNNQGGSVGYIKEAGFDFHEVDVGVGQRSPDSNLSTAVTCTSAVDGEDRRLVEDVVSSQNSVVSSQNSTDFPSLVEDQNKPCTLSNLETEELMSGGKGSCFSSFRELLEMADCGRIDCSTPSFPSTLAYSYQNSSSCKFMGIERPDFVVSESNWAYVNQSGAGSHRMHIKETITRYGSCMRSSKNATDQNEPEATSVARRSDSFVPTSTPQTNKKSHNNDRRNTVVAGSAESRSRNEVSALEKVSAEMFNNASKEKKVKPEREKKKTGSFNWESLRKEVCSDDVKKERRRDRMDSLDYEALRRADVNEISSTIRERGMNNMLAERIKAFLDRLVRDHGSIDLEWLRDIPPDKAKDYLLSIRGLGLKSVECVRLLTLHHIAFPVDTNVGRISVRLGWVPLQPLPESLQIHLLEMYPILETVQKYLWPRLCKLDQATLYELHYHLITFGKVFCTKSKPNCNACPLRGECKHFASAFASARLALPGPEEKCLVPSEAPLASEAPIGSERSHDFLSSSMPSFPQLGGPTFSQERAVHRNFEPIIEEPATPEPESIEETEIDIEDAFYNDPDEIPTIHLNFEEFTQNLQSYMEENNMGIQDGDMSKALVAITPEAASIPMPKLKNVSRLRTEHLVYELPDSHPLLEGLDTREPDDPCRYLLAIWTPGETAQSTEPPTACCSYQGTGKLCDKSTCFSCNSVREAQTQTVRGTLLIPCRTANRGSFPLNGTYFQVNEVFADHESSRDPIDVPRDWIWNLQRRTVYFGTSIPSIFKGLTTEGIQHCFWRGFVCVRGFDRVSRAPKPLYARLHFPASKVTRNKRAAVREDE